MTTRAAASADTSATVFAVAGHLMTSAARLTVTARLESAAALHDAALAEIELEAVRLRAVVATERAALARLRRKGAAA